MEELRDATVPPNAPSHVASVNFSTGLAWLRDASANDFRWFGRGELRIESGTLIVRARQHRMFRTAALVEHAIPLGDVRNVEAAGPVLRVEIAQAAITHKFHAWFDTAEAAQDFASRLPATRTPAFRPALGEAQQFASMLEALQPRTRASLGLIAAITAAYVFAGIAGGGWFVPDARVLQRFGSNFTPWTLGGEWWRLLTSVFLHFGFLHFALNAWSLATVGPMAERLYGSARFLLVYLVAGIAGGLASVLWHPVVNSAGASGAIFGVFGAIGAFLLRQRGALPPSVLAAQRVNIATIVALNLLNGLRVTGIDNAAHLGGLVAGFALGLLLAENPDRVLASGRSRAKFVGAGFAVAAAGVVAAVGIATGVLHPRGDDAPLAYVAPAEPAPLREFWGLRIGATSAEVRALKGDPRALEPGHWTYDAAGPARDGLVDLLFDGDGRLVAIYYQGDGSGLAASALPLIRSRDAALRLATRFGTPMMDATLPNGTWIVRYANGAAAFGGEGSAWVGIDYR